MQVYDSLCYERVCTCCMKTIQCQLRLLDRLANIRAISYYHSIIIWLILSLRKTTDMFEL